MPAAIMAAAPDSAFPCLIPIIGCGGGSGSGSGGSSGGSGGIIPNPFAILADGLRGMLVSFLTLLQKLLIKPVLPSNGTALDYLYGQSIGLSGLAFYLATIAFVFALFFRRALPTFLESLLALAFISALTALTFQIWDWLINARSEFAMQLIAAEVFGRAKNILDGGGSFGGVIITIILLAPILYYIVYLIVMVYIEAIAIIVVKFATPIALMIFPYGDRGKRLLSWCFSAGFVSCFAGPLTAILALQLGKLLILSLDKSAIATGLFTVASLRIAAKSQRSMYKALMRRALTVIRGAVSGASRVSGNVNSTISQQLDVNVRSQAAAAHQASIPATMGKQENTVKHYSKLAVSQGIAFAAGVGEAKLLAQAANAARAGKAAHTAKAGAQLAGAVKQSQLGKRGKGQDR